MNIKNVKLYLPLLQALADGELIQFESARGKWIDVQSVYESNPASSYRIKPKLREVWVNEWKPAGKVVFDSPEEAAEHAKRYGIGHVTTHYREVIE